MTAKPTIPNQTRTFELLAVLFTGLGKFIMVDGLNLKFWFILLTSLFWVLYVARRVRQNPRLLHYWGFRKEGFNESLKWILPFGILSTISFVAYGAWQGVWIIHWNILPVMVLYPLWGIVQQFLIIGLIVKNMTDYEGMKFPVWITILTASILFSTVHYPSMLLMIGTFVLAVLYSLVYLRYSNLWVLGLFHGWLGGWFYFLVLGRDPWLEFIQAIQK